MMFHTFDRPRPKIMVVSHERSGTHFLMNSIAKCYGYLASPWINFDYELGLNFFNPATIAEFFAQFGQSHLANIVKLHHSFAFFERVFDALAKDFHFFFTFTVIRATRWSAIGSFFGHCRGTKVPKRKRARNSFAPNRAPKCCAISIAKRNRPFIVGERTLTVGRKAPRRPVPL